MASLVEAMHYTIAGTAARFGPSALAYSTLRGVARLVGGGMDAMLAPLIPILAGNHSWPEREAMLAVVNGVLGDHLARTDNPLAIHMRLRRLGQPLKLERRALAASIPQPSGKVLVLVHGLCMNDLHWTRKGHNHGAALAGEQGWTPVHLHYNSGLHISSNGREFSGLLESLIERWPTPVRELAIVGHSGGGLVARSACHYGKAAGHRWPRHLRKLVFLGTPHHGSPLERGGNLVNIFLNLSPISAPLARIAGIRSAGITDMRFGSMLDEDWQGMDRFKHSGDLRRRVPLPERVRCYAMAATREDLHGDGLVPLDSALGRHDDPKLALSFAKSRQWVGRGISHWDLLSHPTVYSHLRDWLVPAMRRRSPAQVRRRIPDGG